jgi:transcriptional regulator with PAS, ATPase and Fis domain
MNLQHVCLIGESPVARVMREDVACAARCDAKVLITGETGVGKEVVAQLIHRQGGRAARSLLSINCAGVADSLLESELFGHVRGSFTGAHRDKAGLLEIAAGGTLFLDEVGEMSPRMQAVVLRFLETGEIQRVGALRAQARVNVRLVTASCVDLAAAIGAGSFREDLYYRLNVIRISIPPLRERRTDIPLFVDHFLDLFAARYGTRRPQLSPAAMDALQASNWPGNIRQLKNAIERLVIRNLPGIVRPEDLPFELLPPASSPALAPGRTAESQAAVVKRLATQLEQGASFWSVIYPVFMARDLTRAQLRALVRRGLEHSGGSYRGLAERFTLRPEEYKQFLTFLRKHECHVPFQPFRQRARAAAGRALVDQ